MSTHSPDLTTAAPGSDSLRALFDAAMDQPEAQRAAWLETHVADTALRARIQRLIAADAAQGALDQPAAQRAAHMDLAPDLPAAELLGQTFAGFRLVRLLGQGGMATVFLGVREGVDFEQRAAIKLLRHGLYSALEQQLFQRERRVLASLHHPHIAHLIDGGVLPSGVPYLVLEFVDGMPITDYAHQHALDARERVQLLATVCEAVAAAHRALIVHRDLKPGNILVDVRGQVKLLDFGIAKLLDDDTAEQSAPRTARNILTPEYAAPEQILQREVTTATDVYALGVIARELLSGTSPSTGSGTATTQHVTRIGLRGDLDKVVRKALTEDPALRYPDAAALAEDLHNYLHARPVRAHPPSGWYRARKFVRRHLGGVLITTLLVLGLLTSLGVALWQARVARQQAARAQEVQAFIETLFAPVNEGKPSDQAPTVQTLLERGAARIEASYPNDPDVRADLLALFARLHMATGDNPRARHLAESAATATRMAYGENDARSLDAAYVHGEVLRRLGEFDAATAVLEDLRARSKPGLNRARVLDALSMIRMNQGLGGMEAIALKQEALRERERDPAHTEEDLAVGYNNLGTAYQHAGDFDQALLWLNRALAINRARRPDSRSTAVTLTNVGMVQAYAGHYRPALDTLNEASAVFARIPLSRHQSVATLYTHLCRVETELDQHDAARAHCDQALAINEAVLGPQHQSLIWALSRRIDAAYARGDFAAGLSDRARARAILATTSGDRSYNESILLGVELRRLRYTGEYAGLRDSALRLLGTATRPGLALTRGRSPGELMFEAYLALACAHAPDPACTDHGPERVRALLAHARFRNSDQRLAARNLLAETALHDNAQNDNQAQAVIDDLRDAPAQFASVLGAQHGQVVLAHALLAEAHARLGQADAAAAERTLAQQGAAALSPTHPIRLRVLPEPTPSK